MLKLDLLINIYTPLVDAYFNKKKILWSRRISNWIVVDTAHFDF